MQAAIFHGPKQDLTIEELDIALQTLLDTNHADSAIEYITKLLPSLDGVLTLSQFDSFSRKLIDGPGDRFNSVFVSWMLSGERTLCDGLNTVLSGPNRSEKPIDLPIKDYNLSPDEQVFLCRKAIGYLFF